MPESNLPEAPISVEEARRREEELAAQAVAEEARIKELGLLESKAAFLEATRTGKSAIAQEMSEREKAMGTPTIGRMVVYRSRTGNYSIPAVVNCTIGSIYQPGVEAGNVPAITSADRVHLTVFTPGLPGMRVEADDFVVTSDQPISENVAGCYQEWNIPFDPEGAPGTWKWPERV